MEGVGRKKKRTRQAVLLANHVINICSVVQRRGGEKRRDAPEPCCPHKRRPCSILWGVLSLSEVSNLSRSTARPW